MGPELVLSLRLPPLHGACLLPGCRELPDACFLRRNRIFATADSCSSNLEHNFDWKFDGVVDRPYHNHHQQHQPFHPPFQPFQHRHNQRDIGRHPSWPGSAGFSFASPIDDDAEKREYRSLFISNAECSPFPSRGSCNAVNSIYTGGGIDLPFSLRVLKRKQRESALVSGFSVVGNSLLNAFSSVVTVMKTLQSYILHTRKQFVGKEIDGLLDQIQREMHVSFIWLFQQVFAYTPELMVLVMVLLADFTAFSIVNNLPVLPSSFNTPPISVVSPFLENVKADKGLREMLYKSLKPSPSTSMDKAVSYNSNGGWIGNGGKGTYRIACNEDGGQDPSNSMVKLNKALYSVKDHLSTERSLTSSAASHFVLSDDIGILPNSDIFSGERDGEPEFSASAAAIAFEELARENVNDNEPLLPVIADEGYDSMESGVMSENARNSNHFALDQMDLQILVAPLTTKLEDDDYACYDKTDLVYQEAISKDSNNSLLLANYAQFLFLVRKDYDRAEELFGKAVSCDPYDCDAISRFANFLWLVRHNLGAAEKAYQAALRADDNNSFHAANYAHFLWISGL